MSNSNAIRLICQAKRSNLSTRHPILIHNEGVRLRTTSAKNARRRVRIRVRQARLHGGENEGMKSSLMPTAAPASRVR